MRAPPRPSRKKVADPWVEPWAKDYEKKVLANTSATKKKRSKGSVYYRPGSQQMTMSKGRRCLECKHFRHPFLEHGADQSAPGECALVNGAIAKEAYCSLWSEK